MNEILNINNVHGYLDKETGMAYLNAEDVARGFGFTRTANSGNVVVRWERVNRYLTEFGFVPTRGHGVTSNDFLPENMVYRLGFKASNETAQKFQALLADKVLPSIRKHGAYLTPEKIEEVLLNPDTIIKLATELKEEREKVKVLTPKAEFYDTVASTESLLSMGEVAKVLDMGIGRNKLYKFLRDKNILMEDNIPYQRYVDAGYFKLTEKHYMSGEDSIVSTSTYVKQKGVDFIRKLLQKDGYKRVERKQLKEILGKC